MRCWVKQATSVKEALRSMKMLYKEVQNKDLQDNGHDGAYVEANFRNQPWNYCNHVVNVEALYSIH